ncbi:hypothetical protein QCA50_017914 [Cerrena zonata]|uniref:Uncharacterized protein n=1 Tax=Cerrena zonata TaxID=2478898 RepID=A0AAW0FE39_9APHY
MPSASNLIRFLALSVTALSAVATPSRTVPDVLPFNPLQLAARAPAPEPYLTTNAQRMARGLPPKKPRFNHARRLVARQSATPCVPLAGIIGVALDGAPSTGYLASALNAFGEFQYTQNLNEALEVSICFTEGPVFDIKPTNGGNPTYPFLGAVTGFANSDSNLSPSNFNYVYLAGTTQTPAGSTPQRQANAFSAAAGVPEDVESAIWSINTATNVLSSNWVNTDGSVPAQTIRFIASSNAFAVTGSVAQFESNFGASQGAVLTFIAA